MYNGIVKGFLMIPDTWLKNSFLGTTGTKVIKRDSSVKKWKFRDFFAMIGASAVSQNSLVKVTYLSTLHLLVCKLRFSYAVFNLSNGKLIRWQGQKVKYVELSKNCTFWFIYYM